MVRVPYITPFFRASATPHSGVADANHIAKNIQISY